MEDGLCLLTLFLPPLLFLVTMALLMKGYNIGKYQNDLKFMIKPFACQKKQVYHARLKILYTVTRDSLCFFYAMSYGTVTIFGTNVVLL